MNGYFKKIEVSSGQEKKLLPAFLYFLWLDNKLWNHIESDLLLIYQWLFIFLWYLIIDKNAGLAIYIYDNTEPVY